MSLKSAYRLFIDSFDNIGQRIRIKKQWIYEQIEIRKMCKSAPVHNRKLTKEQIKLVQDYWHPLYGKSIPVKWHEKYYGYSGKMDVKYFPEILYTTKLEPLMNKDNVSRVLRDKSMIELLFARVLDNNRHIVVPKTIVGCSYGNCFDSERNAISRNKCQSILSVFEGECIIKPTIGGSSGSGVRLLNMCEGIDKNTGDDVSNILNRYGEHFIVQEKIQQHPAYARLHPNSVNTIRAFTYRVNGEIRLAPVIMRIGANSSHLDNAHAGGMYIAVSDDGVIQKRANRNYFEPLEVHPDTGIRFEGYQLPEFERILKAAKELHTCLPNMGFVNWDLAMDEDGKVVLIECNMSCGSIWLFQNAWGKGVFGADTEYMISLIK